MLLTVIYILLLAATCCWFFDAYGVPLTLICFSHVVKILLQVTVVMFSSLPVYIFEDSESVFIHLDSFCPLCLFC